MQSSLLRCRNVLAAAAITSLFAIGQTAFAADTLNVTVLGTSDLHGHILPADYFIGVADQGGLAQISSYVKQVRAENPYTVLIDDGDTTEGGNSVLSAFYTQGPDRTNPMALAMNTVRYDAMTVGNHEFNYGQKSVAKFASEVTFPILGANVLKADGTPAYTPYIIKNLGPVKVAIIGVITPNVPNWEKAENIEGLTFVDPVAVAKRYAVEARAKGADIVVLAAHTGTESQPKDIKDPANWNKAETYAGNGSEIENFIIRLADGVPGVDAILAGHAHNVISQIGKMPGIIGQDVIVSEPGSWGDYVSRFDFSLEKVGASWKVADKKATLVAMTKDTPVDSAVVAAAKQYDAETSAYFAKTLGTATADFVSGPRARTFDSGLIEIVNQAQLVTTGADISCTALFSDTSRLDKGAISIRDAYGIYVYSNTLYKIQVTGSVLRAALEQDATYWNQYTDQKNLTDLVAPNARGYNWDIYSGIDYAMDLTKPVGQRVTKLQFKGKDIKADQVLTLAINNYRATGGGNYPMFKSCPVLWTSTSELKEIVASYMKSVGTFNPSAFEDGSFKLLPEVITTLPVK